MNNGISMCRGSDQPADNGPDCRRAERDPSGITAVMDMVDDMMPRRRRAMRTMPPMMRRGNRRASRQNHPSHENRNCLDCSYHTNLSGLLVLTQGKESSSPESDKYF